MNEMSLPDAQRLNRSRITGITGAMVAIVLSTIGLAGWAFGIELLKSIIPGLPRMLPNTAVGLLAGGVGLLLLFADRRRKGDGSGRFLHFTALACASFVLAEGLLTLLQHVTGRSLGIDQLLFTVTPRPGQIVAFPGRPSPQIAGCHVLIGLALFLLRPAASRTSAVIGQSLMLIVIFMALTALSGYALGVMNLNGIAAYTGMALHTSLAFLSVTAGILCLRPDRGWMAAALGDSPGAMIARHLSIAVLIGTVALSLAVLWGRQSGLLSTTFGLAFFGTGFMGLLMAMVWGYAVSLDRSEAARQQALQEVRRLNAELESRVRERTRELQLANNELQSFSYSVSHDLRAPLRSIEGFSAALVEDYAASLNGEGHDYLRRIRSATVRMGGLIDDMLALSRLSRHEFSVQRVDLSAIADTVIRELREHQPARRVETRVDPGLTVTGDPSLLRVVLDNLIGNAWKFTAGCERAEIRVGADRQNGSMTCYVRDNGAGFEMEYAGRLFMPFQRLHSVDEFEGSGIGLATVQRIIHRHGGTIRAEGVRDAGATFIFTLPDAAPVTAPAAEQRLAG